MTGVFVADAHLADSHSARYSHWSACDDAAMPSHFSTIGFDVTSAESMLELVERIRPAAVPIITRRGTYLRWTSPSGAELWLQVNKRSELVGVHPHFAGTTNSNVMIDRVISRDDQTELDGALHGWMNAKPETGGGDYPLVMDCANYFEFRREAPPAFATLQISAFAHEIWTYESVDAFNAAQQNDELRYASQSFIPAGTFGDREAPQAEALFCGHVLTSEIRHNDLTGRAFYSATVQTYAATIDVVADTKLTEAWPTVGGVLKGVFWLTACITSMATRAGVIKQLAWRLRTAG